MRWAVVGVLAGAGALVGLSATVVATLGRSLAGCYIDAVPMPVDHLCAAGLWGAEWVPFVVLAASLITFVATVAAAVGGLVHQFGGAGRLARRLEAHMAPLPDRLRVCADRGSVTDIRYIDIDEPVAVTVGPIRTRILVTRGLVTLLNDDELEAVLRHEAVHLRGRHPALYGLTRSAAAAAFALPAVGPAARNVVLQSEIAADAAAIRALGVRPLVSALAKLVDLPAPNQAAAVGSVQGMLDQRIAVLAGEQPPEVRGPGPGVATAAAAAVLLLPALTVFLAFLSARGRL